MLARLLHLAPVALGSVASHRVGLAMPLEGTPVNLHLCVRVSVCPLSLSLCMSLCLHVNLFTDVYIFVCLCVSLHVCVCDFLLY